MPEKIDKNSTHLPLLKAAVEATSGPVLELGQGEHTTKYLREACAGRIYLSADSRDEEFQEFDSGDHRSFKLANWDDLYNEIGTTRFSVAVLDHAPVGRRRGELERLRDQADLILVHDAAIDDYRYETIFGTFKHRYTHGLRRPETTVVSNNSNAFNAFKDALCKEEGCTQLVEPVRKVVLVTFCTPDLYAEDAREMLASVDDWQGTFRENGVTMIPYVYPIQKQGSWKKNTFMKPTAILAAFDEYPQADAFLYLDADARMVNPLPVRWMVKAMAKNGQHVAAHILKRRSSIELLSGTMMFQNSDKAREILVRWRDEAAKMPGLRGDQDVLHKMLRIPKTKKFVPEFRDLPPEWTWIATGNRMDVSGKLYGKRSYYIKHTQASRRLRKGAEGVERGSAKLLAEATDNRTTDDQPVGRTPGQEMILVWARTMYRPAQEKPLRDKIEASGFDYAFTREPDLRKWVEKNGKPAALIRWDESAGVNGLRSNMVKLTKTCYELGIAPLYIDFGYFDHYKAYTFDWYMDDGHPSLTNGALWNAMSDDDSWRDDETLQDYFQRVKEAYEKAANSDPIAEGDYILAFAQCTARRCRLPDSGNTTEGWLKKLVEVVGKDRLVIKQPPAQARLYNPEGVRIFGVRGEKRAGPGMNPTESMLELNANLAYHASAIVSNTSSVSNEMLLMNIPMFMTGKSWFHGLGVFDEPETWEEIANRKPVLGPPHLTNRFAHWWISRREPYDGPHNLLTRIIDEWHNFGYNKPAFTESEPCRTRAHCRACRTDQEFRDGLKRAFSLPDDFDTVCPHGVTEESLSKPALFTETPICKGRQNCRICRTDQKFRDNMKQHFEVPDDFDTVCPHGVTEANLPPPPPFIESPACEARMSCHACRTNQQFRDNIRKTFEVPDDFDTVCPHGITEDMLDPPQPPDLPPAKEQLKNFAAAVARTAKRLATGKKVVANEEKRAERIKICQECPLLRGLRCSKCGCNTVAKVALEGEKCPEGKW
jgi:hypothetical protein